MPSRKKTIKAAKMLDEKECGIMILCKVVDNFGDIGVCYRLARSILEVLPKAKIDLVVSDLASFSVLDGGVDSKKAVQFLGGFWVYDWNKAKICKRIFSVKKPKIILECFECGRPDWLEEILFKKENTQVSHIINLEYLTAEKWADEFHKLKSGTRSVFIKKSNFMPGFSKNTAGLILDNHFMKCLSDKRYALSFFRSQSNLYLNPADFTAVIFSYERDFSPVVKALSRFASLSKKKVCVFLTQGKSRACFLKAFENEEKNTKKKPEFTLTELPFLPQKVWDTLLTLTNFNFVRGEDSLSRAVLSGTPFAWHAYPQKDEQQLVKANALTARMKPFFSAQNAKIFEDFTQEYNRENPELKKIEELLLTLFLTNDELLKGFKAFSKSVIEIGNLSKNLLDYISDLSF